jgi:CBS-domain-containing membrane protein
MTASPDVCRPDESLTAAAGIMWHRDCGAVPVVDEQQRVVGIITDRDICIGVASLNARARGIRVSEVMSTGPVTCSEEDSVEDVLNLMAERQVHRVPVTGADGILVGIVSLGDLIHHTGKKAKKSERISRKEVFAAIKAIAAPRKPAEVKREADAAAASTSSGEAQ